MKIKSFYFYGLSFCFPFLFIFGAFIAFPLLYGLFLSFIKDGGFTLIHYINALRDEMFIKSLYNTAIYVGIAVNIKIFLAFILSSILNFPYRIIKVLKVVYVFSWALPMVSAAIAFHWILHPDYGIINAWLQSLGFEPVNWLGNYSTAMIVIIFFHIWKYLPFWTLTFYAGRQSIPKELYESAEIDGAKFWNRFLDITLPHLKSLYLLCIVLSTIWVTGEFMTVWLLTFGRAQTHVLATYSYVLAFFIGEFGEALAMIMLILPIIITLLFMVFRFIEREEI